MTLLQDSIKTVLRANGGLTTFFTGGIVSFADLPAAGLSRSNYPAAFDERLRLKPILVIKERAELPTGAIKDENAQRTSTVQAVEVWYYSASDGNYDDLETQRSIVRGLLQDRTVASKRFLRRERRTMERDTRLGNAAIVYDVYDAIGTTTT